MGYSFLLYDVIAHSEATSNDKSTYDIFSKDEMYKANLRQQSRSMQKTSSFHSEDSAIKLDNEPRQRKTYAYEKTDQVIEL